MLTLLFECLWNKYDNNMSVSYLWFRKLLTMQNKCGTLTGRAIFQDTRSEQFYFRLRHQYREDENPRKSFRDANISIFISIIRTESAPRCGSDINNDLSGITINLYLIWYLGNIYLIYIFRYIYYITQISFFCSQSPGNLTNALIILALELCD